MPFNKHFLPPGSHARLSPSNYHWLDYSDDKMERVFYAAMMAERGNQLHEFAANAIRLGISLPDEPKTLNMYVNDCIGFRMTSEQMLYYSENAFGTADAISDARNRLKVADLKTGTTPTKEIQLKVYAALYCLEYRKKPFDLEQIELRIYQNNEVRIYEADPVEIAYIMDRIVTLDKLIRQLKEENQ